METKDDNRVDVSAEVRHENTRQMLRPYEPHMSNYACFMGLTSTCCSYGIKSYVSILTVA